MAPEFTRSIRRSRPIVLAFALSTSAMVSLGITRFAYGLLLPVMRDDLGWTYTLAGAMNTVNAAGYLVGALMTPILMRRLGVARLLLWGTLLASLFMALSGFVTAATPLLIQRFLAGVASGFVFISGGVLAARLGKQAPLQAGLLLGIYYGGVGFGILISAVGVPVLLTAAANQPHAWQCSWWGLALACVLTVPVLLGPARALDETPGAGWASLSRSAPGWLPWVQMTPMLLGYTLFGVGYIGYMTFVIALLRDQGLGGMAITLFYSLLGMAVVASARIWAALLDRSRGGGALSLLSALLGLATLLPALTQWLPTVVVSGALFGGVFLSLVASTTAFVRHNLPEAQWTAGISLFTILFAFGQIAGPTLVGWIADGPGGLERGLIYSAAALFAGAAVAVWQKPLAAADGAATGRDAGFAQNGGED